ncbi:MAG: 5-methyltetrahydropteroyltriglutamate--homocysteine S-methyltransferase [Chloroflexota bacterium]
MLAIQHSPRLGGSKAPVGGWSFAAPLPTPAHIFTQQHALGLDVRGPKASAKRRGTIGRGMPAAHTATRFRADHVGSFLRPQAVQDAHTAHAQGTLSREALREREDQAILDVLRLQKEVGLDIFSDGEFRRSSWSSDFADAVDGFTQGPPAVTVFNTAAGNAPQQRPANFGRVIASTLRPRRRLTEDEAAFMRQHAPGPFKMTMPAASYVLARGYHPEITNKAYGSRAAALDAVARIIRSEVDALVAEGVPYVQLDNPHYPDYISAERSAEWRALGIDPEQALREDVAADNLTLSGVDRSKVILAMHVCRGNGGRGPDQPAGWHTSGPYDAIAEAVFGGLDVDRFLLEYDSERAGGFEPLRFISKGKVVVLGLVTTKSGELESEDTLMKRIEEAAKYVAVEDLALSPQCGFASTMAGNPLTVDDERRKLELVVRTARRVWG